jgi:hypothetical protein
MSVSLGSVRRLISWSFIGLLAIGCQSTPNGPAVADGEEGDMEASIERDEMMKHRARLEPKTGISFPMNNEFEVADPSDGVGGIKGAFEAIQKGFWFGLEFDYMAFDSKNPAQTPVGTPNEPASLAAFTTETLIKNFDRYTILATFEYDILLGDHVPTVDNPGFDFFSPIFSFGIGLGGTAFNIEEAPGNVLTEFDKTFTFVARPTVQFRFPFHENFGLFIEGNYDWIPEVQLEGQFRPTDENVEIGDKVDFSTGNVWIGLTFQF